MSSVNSSNDSSIMWKTVLPDYNTCWEPIELRSLKRQLANITCKCKTCDKNKELMEYRHAEEQKDREIQAKPSKGLLDSFVQATVSPNFVSGVNGIPHSYFPDKVRDDIPCPSCYVILNLLRYGFAKVFKDVEIETKHEMFSCDKSTENKINSLEKTTSLTIRPAMLRHSRLSLCDDITEQTSQSTWFPSKKSSHREVTFLLDGANRSPEETESEQFSFNALVGNCVCKDNYINSIRPPWTDL